MQRLTNQQWENTVTDILHFKMSRGLSAKFAPPSALLESPYFVYRTELGPAGGPLDADELASKLSFWLLGTTPSDSLLDAAAAGMLAQNDGLEATTRQMLADPRAVLMVRDFHAQLLQFALFQTLSKVSVPEFTPALNAELTLASNAFFDRVFQQNLGLREILTSTQAYVSPGLASFFSVSLTLGQNPGTLVGGRQAPTES